MIDTNQSTAAISIPMNMIENTGYCRANVAYWGPVSLIYFFRPGTEVGIDGPYGSENDMQQANTTFEISNLLFPGDGKWTILVSSPISIVENLG